jgi:hypothetical protein
MKPFEFTFKYLEIYPTIFGYLSGAQSETVELDKLEDKVDGSVGSMMSM